MEASLLHRRVRESVAATANPQLQRGTDDEDEQAPEQKAKKAKKAKAKPKPKPKVRESLRILIREAQLVKSGACYEATILSEGPGNPDDRNAYTREALQGAVAGGLFEGLHCYANHPTPSEERERPERDVRQLIGHFREARYLEESGRARVRAKFVPIQGPGYEWVTSLIESALSSVPGRPLIGISIDGYGHAPDSKEIGGRTYSMVRELISLGSADIVPRTATGGQFHRRLSEAWRTHTIPARTRPGQQEDQMKASKLQEKITAAVGKLDEAAALKDDDEAGQTLVDEALTVLRECASAEIAPEVKIQEKIVEKPVAATDGESDQLAVKLQEAETALAGARDETKRERKARKEAEVKLQEVDKAKLAAKVLREAEISPKTAQSWFEDLIDEEDEQAMRKLVERRKAERDEWLAEVRESYGVEGAGPRAPTLQGAPATGGLLERMGIDRDELAAA